MLNTKSVLPKSCSPTGFLKFSFPNLLELSPRSVAGFAAAPGVAGAPSGEVPKGYLPKWPDLLQHCWSASCSTVVLLHPAFAFSNMGCVFCARANMLSEMWRGNM